MTNPWFGWEHGKAKAVLSKIEARLTPEIGEAILQDESLVRVGMEAIEARMQAEQAYKLQFDAAIKACACEYYSRELNVETFNEDVFGTLGEGYVLAQPPNTEAVKFRRYWTKQDIDAWHASADVAGKGLEAAYLVDLSKYGEISKEGQREKTIVCWRAGKNDCVAFLDWANYSNRCFNVNKRDDDCWRRYCWFLLRKVQKPVTL